VVPHICQEHEEKIEKNDGKYKCLVCDEYEIYPEKGFIINKNIQKIMTGEDHLTSIFK
jgi:hypothetical protein